MVKILVIDDNVDAAKTLSMAMELAGYEVMYTTSGEDALGTIQLYVPDVVLCDISMPGLAGYDVCKQLKADPRLKHTLFFATTAYGTIDRKLRSIDAGFHHHFVKPVDIAKLTKVINDSANVAA